MTGCAGLSLCIFAGAITDTARNLPLLALRMVTGHLYLLTGGYLPGHCPFAIAICTGNLIVLIALAGDYPCACADRTFFFETGQPLSLIHIFSKMNTLQFWIMILLEIMPFSTPQMNMEY